jgi:hypothetical protein
MSPVTGKCASGNPAILLPLRKREFPDEGGEGEEAFSLFPVFIFMEGFLQKEKKRSKDYLCRKISN